MMMPREMPAPLTGPIKAYLILQKLSKSLTHNINKGRRLPASSNAPVSPNVLCVVKLWENRVILWPRTKYCNAMGNLARLPPPSQAEGVAQQSELPNNQFEI